MPSSIEIRIVGYVTLELHQLRGVFRQFDIDFQQFVSVGHLPDMNAATRLDPVWSDPTFRVPGDRSDKVEIRGCGQAAPVRAEREVGGDPQELRDQPALARGETPQLDG